MLALTENIFNKTQIDLSNKQISDICVVKNGKLECVYFSKNELPPQEMLEMFIIIGQNEFFDHLWKQAKENLDASGDISFTDIFENVWKPTILNCQSLLSKIHKKSITVEEIRVYESIQDIGKQILALYSGMQKCFPDSISFTKSNPPNKWIKEVNDHITLFHKAYSEVHKNGLEYCLSLKNSQSLTGDFSMIQELNDQVSKNNVVMNSV